MSRQFLTVVSGQRNRAAFNTMVSNATPTKRSRRLGVRFIPKLDKYVARRPYPPGPRKRGRRRGKLSEYGLQLMEKQKAKFFYNLRERQFRRMVDKAIHGAQASSDALTMLLETRLDNVIFRAGFALTHFQARQIVSHRHILLNGRRVNIPSHQVKPGDTITVSRVIYHDEKAQAPDWLKIDHVKHIIEVKRWPTKEEIVTDIDFEKIISFYSR